MHKGFVNFANRVAEASGYPSVFAVAVATVLMWLATGPLFEFSVTWQLVMNTLTSVITFLMVFLIQTLQNRDSRPCRLGLRRPGSRIRPASLARSTAGRKAVTLRAFFEPCWQAPTLERA
jgi:low affinity iron permease